MPRHLTTRPTQTTNNPDALSLFPAERGTRDSEGEVPSTQSTEHPNVHSPLRGRRGRATARRGSLALLAFLCLTVLALTLACTGNKNPSPTPTQAPDTTSTATSGTPTPITQPPTPTATPKPIPSPPAGARPFPPDLKEEGDKILARVAELKGMPPKAPVAMNLVSRKPAIDYYRNNYDDEAKAQTEVQQDIYELLGMVPKGSDINDLFLGLLGVGILGFYDPDQNAFYLLDDLGGLDSVASRTTIVHELAHALQDQYYDINKLQKQYQTNHDWDGGTAFLDVIEGDAVATEGAYRNASARRAPCFQIPAVTTTLIPYVIQRELNTWYEDGYCFVDAVAPAINNHAAIFDNLPTTTEQILHPEKYTAGEKAVPVTPTALDQALGPAWKQIDHANFGEFTLQNLLVLGLRSDRPRAQRAAAGWGGDGWLLYGNGDTRLFELVTAWDSPEAAREFFDTLFDSLNGRPNVQVQTLTPRTDTSFSLQIDTSTWRVALQNDRTTILVSSDPAALTAAATRLNLP